MSTKIKLIDRAYSKLEVSGINFNPSPEDVTIALDELETMMAELDSRNICVGFNFEDDPDPSSDSYVPRWAENAVQTNVAIRLATEFGKVANQGLSAQANQSMSNLVARTAKVRGIAPSSRQPVGSGNTFRWNSWRRYYHVADTSPLNCSTQIMAVNDEASYTVDYTEWLKGDSILSYELVVDDDLTLISDSNNSSAITIKVKADSCGTQTVAIKITTVDGRVDNRTVYFSVVETKEAVPLSVSKEP